MNAKYILSLLAIGFYTMLPACETCAYKQPKFMQNITHGVGPQNNMDYIITGIALGIVIFTLVLSIKYLVKPGEKNPDHIKNIVVNQNPK